MEGGGEGEGEGKSKFSERGGAGKVGERSWGGNLSTDREKDGGYSKVLGRNGSVPELGFQKRILEQQS